MWRLRLTAPQRKPPPGYCNLERTDIGGARREARPPANALPARGCRMVLEMILKCSAAASSGARLNDRTAAANTGLISAAVLNPKPGTDRRLVRRRFGRFARPLTRNAHTSGLPLNEDEIGANTGLISDAVLSDLRMTDSAACDIIRFLVPQAFLSYPRLLPG